MNSIVSLKTADDDFQVEYEILTPIDISAPHALEKQEINLALQDIDEQLDLCQHELDNLLTDIDRLTCHADGVDYALAVTSGVLTGLIDSLFVGEWNFKNAKAKSNEEVNEKITEFAKKDSKYSKWCQNTDHNRKARDPDRLDSAIEFLEEHYHLPGDSDWDVKTKLVRIAKEKGFDGKGYENALQFLNNNFPKEGGWAVVDNFITAKSHHLDDLCHHPTVVGLICCIIVQFTGSSLYSNKSGDFIKLPVTVNEYGKFVGKNEVTKLFSGVINWFLNCAHTMANRKGHLFSDMAGSSSSILRNTDGMGLPGSFLSTMKELSALPIFHGTGFAENLRKAYQNGIGSGNSQVDLGAFNALFEGASSKLDIRTEMAITHELKRQALPVVINEILVRAGYFIRRFIEECKSKQDLTEIEWKNVIPFNNRTIARMMTIASGTFSAFDMADAAIRSGGFNAACLLRVNFVGVGRFAVAVVTDVSMGVKRSKLQNQQYALIGKQLDLLNVKVSYLYASAQYEMSESLDEQSKLWIAAEDTATTLMEANNTVAEAVSFYFESLQETQISLSKISGYLSAVEQNNPGLTEEMLNTIRWGNHDRYGNNSTGCTTN